MMLSIVIICWNDLKVIGECLRSIYTTTQRADFEVIVSDNGSTDGSREFIQREYPRVRVLENNANLGFARGNNVGIGASRGEYILILNPDTVIHAGALDKWMEFARKHPEAGAFGCRVENSDGSLQGSARPFPTIGRYWLAALYLRKLAYLGDRWVSDTYTGWEGDTERAVDWQSGCCVLFRAEVLNRLGGFDEQFFYHFEEVDLCRRVWQAGYPILYTPAACITHLGGQSVNRFPVRFEIEKYRNRYRYFYKHYGAAGARRCRRVSLAWLWVRQLGYGVRFWVRSTPALRQRLEMYRVCIAWNRGLDPVRFVEQQEEPVVPLPLAA